MANFKVAVDVQRALNKIHRYGNKTQTKVKQAVATSTLRIEAGAKRLAPVDTGRLRGSIKSEIKEGGTIGEVQATADYAAHVEFGTRKMAAQPFMFPSAESERPLFEQAIRKAVKE